MNIIKTLFVIAFISTNANATTTFNIFETSTATRNGSTIDSYQATYNVDTDQFNYVLNVGQSTAGDQINFFTLAVNDGPNPKVGDLALLYVDLDAELVTAYSYNNGRGNTIVNGEYITTLNSAVSSSVNADGSLTVNLGFDATEINDFASTISPDFAGVQFDSLFGQWLHTSFGAQITYEATGEIASLDFGTPGANIDSGNRATVAGAEVPEPMTLTLLGMGILGGAIRRKRA